MLKRFAFIGFLFLFAGNAMCQTGEREADLKAVFIYNFTKYVEWDKNIEGDFVIGVIGSSPVTAALTEIARTNTAKNKRIIIKRFSNPQEISDCHILFIPQKLPFTLESILAYVGKGILTVSEETGYANLGTALNFILVKDKLKFEANIKTINSAGLKVGSQLLKLAVIVDD